MRTALRDRVESYERDALEGAHAPALSCQDAQDLIDVGCGYLASIENKVMRWKQRVAAGKEQFELADAREHYELYRLLGRALDALQGHVVALHREGNVVDNAGRLTEAQGKVRCVLSVPFDEVAASVREAQEGKVRPMSSVLDELLDQHHR